MIRRRKNQRWTLRAHNEILEELEKSIAAFGVLKDNAKIEMAASLDHLVNQGKHPEELSARGPYRCFPIVVWPDAVLYLVFREVNESIFVILHVTRVSAPKYPGQLIGPRPDLPEAGWGLAGTRFEAGGW